MTNKQKQLIDKAKPYKKGVLFYAIYIINSGKNYDGFWGKNDYRQIIVLGETKEHELYKIEGSQYDVLEIDNPYDYRLKFEIHKQNDCLHLWVDNPYKIKVIDNIISNLILEVIKINDK